MKTILINGGNNYEKMGKILIIGPGCNNILFYNVFLSIRC